MLHTPRTEDSDHQQSGDLTHWLPATLVYCQSRDPALTILDIRRAVVASALLLALLVYLGPTM